MVSFGRFAVPASIFFASHVLVAAVPSYFTALHIRNSSGGSNDTAAASSRHPSRRNQQRGHRNVTPEPESQAVVHANDTGNSGSFVAAFFASLAENGGHPHEADDQLMHFKNASGGLDESLPVTIDPHSELGNSLHTVRGIASNVITPVTGVFIVTLLVGHAMGNVHRFYISQIPESAWTVIIAVLLGLFVREGLQTGVISLHGYTMMNVSVLNLGLLPIIIFTSGWTLRRADFVSQIQYILVYAVLGTVLSALMTGFLSSHAATFLGYSLTMRESFVFAALISAVDPVATLATYSKFGIDRKQPLLNTLVFGESVINDAVAIVLFGVINSAPLEEVHIGGASLEVCRLLFGSMAFGIVISCLLLGALRVSRLKGHSRVEVCYIYMCAYFVFNLSEAFHFSGIIATLFSGVLFRRYGTHHLSPHGREMTLHYLENSGFLADNAVFLLCGASTALINSGRAFAFGVFAVLICLAVRAVAIMFCSKIANTLKQMAEDQHVITWKHQVMMWHSGLRGGIALALALEIDGTWCAHKGTIIDATFVVICTLLIFCGGSTEMILRALEMVRPDEQEEDEDELDKKFTASMAVAPLALKKYDDADADARETEFNHMLDDRIHKVLFWLLVSFEEGAHDEPPPDVSKMEEPRL